MKRITSLLLTVLFIFMLTACGQLQQPETVPGSTEAPTQSVPETTELPSVPGTEAPSEAPAANGKTLIVYFSWSGNTEEMANFIQEQTGGDLLKLEPRNAYPTDYGDCADVAKEERDANARPEIANLPDSIAEYDTIFVGYPIWWHTAPMLIGTFLESFDLNGKEIYPFSQSASMDAEQFAESMAFVRENAAGANVHDGLFVSASNTEGILAYLTDSGFAK